MKKLFISVALAAAALAGSCGAERHTAARKASFLVERECMVSIALTDKTECAGADGDHLHCTGLRLTWRKGCETLRISR